MKTFNYITIAFVLLCLSEASTKAQERTSILTRHIEKQFTMDKRPVMYINAERGIISVKGWGRTEVMVTLKLTARNSNTAIARKELDYMKLNISKTRNTVFVSNRMLLPQPDEQISSIILAEYEIFVPHEIEIHVDNRLGKIEIEDVKGILEGELHYNDLSLVRKSGGIGIHVIIGDFNCAKSTLKGTVTTRHSNISITETSGDLHMETEYGSLRTTFGNELFRFSLESNATTINIENNLCSPLGLNLTGTYCPLIISDNCYTPDKQYLESDYNKDGSGQKEWKLIYLTPDKVSKLNINTKFGALNLF